MSLEEQLAKLRAMMGNAIPEHAQAVMHRATDDLRASGIVDRAIKVGAPLPSFELESATGEIVASQNLLEKGAVVLTVFRGHW